MSNNDIRPSHTGRLFGVGVGPGRVAEAEGQLDDQQDERRQEHIGQDQPTGHPPPSGGSAGGASRTSLNPTPRTAWIHSG